MQNKTKYQYDGLRNGERVTVGDYVERPGYIENDETNVAPSARRTSSGVNRIVSAEEASLAGGANAGSTYYQKQIVKNGGPGNILYNNLFLR